MSALLPNPDQVAEEMAALGYERGQMISEDDFPAFQQALDGVLARVDWVEVAA